MVLHFILSVAFEFVSVMKITSVSSRLFIDLSERLIIMFRFLLPEVTFILTFSGLNMGFVLLFSVYCKRSLIVSCL